MFNASIPKEEQIWSLLLMHEGERFETSRGLPFTYSIRRDKSGNPQGEMVIDRKKKTITRSTVMLALQNAETIMEKEDCVSGPKKLGVFGASYLYPVFLKLEIIRSGREDERNVPTLLDLMDGDMNDEV